MLYNSFIFRSYTGRAMTMVMPTDSPGHLRRRADSAPDRIVSLPDITDQPFDSESTGSSEDAYLIPIHSGEDWVAQLDDDLTAVAGDSFRISALQREDPTCITLHT